MANQYKTIRQQRVEDCELINKILFLRSIGIKLKDIHNYMCLTQRGLILKRYFSLKESIYDDFTVRTANVLMNHNLNTKSKIRKAFKLGRFNPKCSYHYRNCGIKSHIEVSQYLSK